MKRAPLAAALTAAFLVGSAAPALAASTVVNHWDGGEAKISGINVNKTVGNFPGIAIVNVKGYVIDLNYYDTLPAGAWHNDVVNGWIVPPR